MSTRAKLGTRLKTRKITAARGRRSRPRNEAASGQALEKMSNAISVVATATSALQSAEDPTVLDDAAERGDKLGCLVQGVAEMRRAFILLVAHQGKESLHE